VFINFHLPDGNGVGLCHILRDEPKIGHSIPIIVLGTGHSTRQQRLAALEAGAWEFLTYPFDAQELLLRIDQYVAAKFDIDRIKQESLVDELTDLYSLRGLERRATELQSLAFRHAEPLACVVLAPTFNGNGEETLSGTDIEAIEAAVNQMARALKDKGRMSDAIGKIGRTEFAIIAPATNAEGAVMMARRLAGAIQAEADRRTGSHFRIRAGFEAVDNVREAQIEALDLLERAAIAMRRAQPADDELWIESFDVDGHYPH
jgi:diguanylate cyclase (GGDEF)-like protein